MIRHLDDGALQALLDGEMDSPTERKAREHLASCAACRASAVAVREASSVVTAALSLLDAPASAGGLAVPPTNLLDAPTPAGVLATPPSSALRRAHRRAVPLARAAVLLLTFAAAASATIPGSPIREWASTTLHRLTAGESLARQPAMATAAAPPVAESGVSVAPDDGRLRIAITGADPALHISAILTDSSRGGAYAIGDAADARFRTSPGTIDVFDPGAGEMRIEIPRAALSATLEIDGRTFMVKEADRLRLVMPDLDSVGAELSFTVGQ